MGVVGVGEVCCECRGAVRWCGAGMVAPWW